MHENTNGFYKINYSGKTSYISALYVKVTGEKIINTNSTSSPTVPAPTCLFQPATPAVKSTGVGTVTASDFLSVRKTASLGSNIMLWESIS